MSSDFFELDGCGTDASGTDASAKVIVWQLAAGKSSFAYATNPRSSKFLFLRVYPTSEDTGIAR